MGTGMRLSLSQIAAAVGGRLIGPDAPAPGPGRSQVGVAVGALAVYGDEQ